MADARRLPLQRRIVTWIPYLWLLVFFLAPFLIVLKISFSTVVLGQPPYEPVFDSLAEIPREDRRALVRQLRLFLLLSALLEGLSLERLDRARLDRRSRS